MGGSRRRNWEAVKSTWPNRDASRFLEAGGLEWHVQSMGEATAPALLLLHGTGASAHSFRDLMPLLAQRYHVITPDLPGHGFTATPVGGGLSLPGMTQLVSRLLEALGSKPVIAAGHSAGAAILLSMAGKADFAPRHIVSINGALEPIQGNALFAPLARLLFMNPFVPRLFALRARFGDISDMVLSKTNSDIDAVGRNCYRELFQSSEHVEGALGMMANWDLQPLQAMMPDLRVAVSLIAAEDDRTVPVSVSRRAAAAIPGARLITVPTGGHLLHEVDPDSIARIIVEAATTIR